MSRATRHYDARGRQPPTPVEESRLPSLSSRPLRACARRARAASLCPHGACSPVPVVFRQYSLYLLARRPFAALYHAAPCSGLEPCLLMLGVQLSTVGEYAAAAHRRLGAGARVTNGSSGEEGFASLCAAFAPPRQPPRFQIGHFWCIKGFLFPHNNVNHCVFAAGELDSKLFRVRFEQGPSPQQCEILWFSCFRGKA